MGGGVAGEAEQVKPLNSRQGRHGGLEAGEDVVLWLMERGLPPLSRREDGDRGWGRGRGETGLVKR